MARMGLLLLATIVVLAVGCQAPAVGQVTLRGMASAGPTCPVETVPPDPECAARPVVGAEIVIRDADGEAVARVRTGEDGSFAVSLAPGRYELVPQPVDGLMGTAGPIAIVLIAGEEPDEVVVGYDTGIR